MSLATLSFKNSGINHAISSTSSNWNSIPHKGMKALPEQEIIKELKELAELSLLYLLEKYKKDTDTQYTKQALPCGGALTPVTNAMGNGFEVSVAGELALCYDGGRLSYAPTVAEQARAQEFYRIYDNAYTSGKIAETEKKQTNGESYFYEDKILFLEKDNRICFDEKG